MTKNKLYFILVLASIAGYAWLYLDLNHTISYKPFTVCLVKLTTTLPCPSCGSTRSAESFLKGNFWEALSYNPLGVLLVLIIAITPVWLLLDLIRKNNSLFLFYIKLEFMLGKKIFAIPAIILVLTNWMWNIHKGL